MAAVPNYHKPSSLNIVLEVRSVAPVSLGYPEGVGRAAFLSGGSKGRIHFFALSSFESCCGWWPLPPSSKPVMLPLSNPSSITECFSLTTVGRGSPRLRTPPFDWVHPEQPGRSRHLKVHKHIAKCPFCHKRKRIHRFWWLGYGRLCRTIILLATCGILYLLLVSIRWNCFNVASFLSLARFSSGYSLSWEEEANQKLDQFYCQSFRKVFYFIYVYPHLVLGRL